VRPADGSELPPDSFVHGVDAEGFVVAHGEQLERLHADYGREVLHTFSEPIRALVTLDPLTVAVDGGRVLRTDGSAVGALTLAARATDGRARYQPAFPALADGAWVGDRLVVAMNDRDLALHDSCLSGVAVLRDGRTLWSAEYRGFVVHVPGTPFVAVPGALLVPDGDGMRAIPLPGLLPACAATVGGQVVLGTLDGLVAFVDPEWIPGNNPSSSAYVAQEV
jgi:hypothetical protein